MNKRTPYEAIIAKKAAQQPVPDLADAIWSAVRAELDQAPPHAEPSGNTPTPLSAPPLSAWRLLAYLLSSAALIAIAVTWWNLRPENSFPFKHPPNPVTPVMPSEKKILRNDSVQRQPLRPAVILPVKDSRTVIDSAARVDDSLQRNTTTPGFQVRPPRNPSITLPDTALHAAPNMKKPRGIKGIGNDDYKIVPEKKGAKPR